jgi:rubredoxin
VTRADQYRCAVCQGVFDRDETDAEVERRCLDTFGSLPPPERRRLLCEACNAAVMSRFMSLPQAVREALLSRLKHGPS